MNSLRKRLTSFMLLMSLFFMIFTTTTSADYTSIALSPSTGTIYADYATLSLSVNSGSDVYIGTETTIAFTGDVSYIKLVPSAKCENPDVIQGSGTLNIACVSQDGETYNGVVATLYFKSTGTGSSTFTFSSTEPNAITKTGGTYTLSTENNPIPMGGGGMGGGDDTLPESGIFDDTRGIIGVGVLLMAFGIFFNHINRFVLSLIATARLNRERKEEERTDKRRGKLEKKF